MRVLLINICLRPYLAHKIFPLGLSYIAGAIHRAGHDLEILDIDANRYSDEEVENMLRQKYFDWVDEPYPSVGYLLPQPGTPMYDLAIERGLIRDEEEYLLNMGDRQDLHINFTSMPPAVFETEIKDN